MERAEIKKNSWVAWSEDELKLLKKLFPRGRAREIAERIGRPLTAVRQKAYSMGIKTRERRLWSANEVKLLKKPYPSENTQSIADKLGRSSEWVRHKANLIGLKKLFLPAIEYIWVELVTVADVRYRLFFEQMQAEKPDFFLCRVLFALVCHVHFLSLIYILNQFQEMSNSD